MKVFTCRDHKGYWPVGTASVVVAENIDEAMEMLEAVLYDRKLGGHDFTLQELDTSQSRVLVLRDGEY